MKVIGIIEQGPYGKLLVEISTTELNNIVGEYGSKSFKVGDQIDVSAIYNRFNRLFNNKNNVAESMKQLRALADLLESFDPVIRKVFEVEGIEDNQCTSPTSI